MKGQRDIINAGNPEQERMKSSENQKRYLFPANFSWHDQKSKRRRTTNETNKVSCETFHEVLLLIIGTKSFFVGKREACHTNAQKGTLVQTKAMTSLDNKYRDKYTVRYTSVKRTSRQCDTKLQINCMACRVERVFGSHLQGGTFTFPSV